MDSAVVALGERSRMLHFQLAALAREVTAPSSVLLLGETGTGKTALAHYLPAQSRAARPARAARPLRKLNCAALSDALLADLIGELDAARRRCESPFTLFLDEVGELSPWCQAVLLHRLQTETNDTRVVAATHRNLDIMVNVGTFSRELLARLAGARIVLSPLRARREEIVPLAMHFLRVGLRNANLGLISVDATLFELVERYDWPGNVRELRNAMLNAIALNESGVLGVEDLPEQVRSALPTQTKGYSR